MSKAGKVPFETTRFVRDACLCLHLQRAARALARRFDDAFRPLGLTSGQYSMMMALNRPEPPSIGQVASVRLVRDRDTGRSRGFAFVEMGSDEHGRAACDALNQQEFEGRRLTVNEARPQEQRNDGFRRGGGGGGRQPRDSRW